MLRSSLLPDRCQCPSQQNRRFLVRDGPQDHDVSSGPPIVADWIGDAEPLTPDADGIRCPAGSLSDLVIRELAKERDLIVGPPRSNVTRLEMLGQAQLPVLLPPSCTLLVGPFLLLDGIGSLARCCLY